MDVLELTRALVSIPSITDEEGAVCAWVAQRLRERGWQVRTQEIAPEKTKAPLPRLNVLAADSFEIPPRVVLTTHLDTVPPFLPLREDADTFWGRGTCDAKGIFAAQWIAAERLRDKGVRGIALLGVVGEETDSWGAKQVSALLPRADWIIDGEPTQLVPASGAKGILALKLSVEGKACHSAYPELGKNAVHVLVSALARLLSAELPFLPEFGQSTVNVGLVEGGVAPNVLAPAASATVLIRLGAPADDVLQKTKQILGDEVQIEITSKSDPHRIHLPPGQDGEVVRFGSDVPYLAKIGKTLLVGPGSIHDAHTSHEHIYKADLIRAVALYEAACLALIGAQT